MLLDRSRVLHGRRGVQTIRPRLATARQHQDPLWQSHVARGRNVTRRRTHRPAQGRPSASAVYYVHLMR